MTAPTANPDNSELSGGTARTLTKPMPAYRVPHTLDEGGAVRFNSWLYGATFRNTDGELRLLELYGEEPHD